MRPQDQFVYIVDSDLSNLKRKLVKGAKFSSRIVLKIIENKYVLRIFGYNLVMQSKINFERFDEAELMVEQTSPKLKLSILGKIKKPQDQSKLLSAKNQKDVII